MYPVLFEIGPITIYSLGIFWTLGALAAVWILRLEFKRCGYDAELASTIVMAAAIGGACPVTVRFRHPLGSQKKHPPPGTIFYFYLVLAGSMCFIVEFWRVNPIVGLGITEYQWISMALVIFGAGLLSYQWKSARNHTPETNKQVGIAAS